MNKYNNNDSVLEESYGLKKALGLFEATALVIGMVIGSGIFFKTTIVFTNAKSTALGLFAWFVGGVITLASGLTVAEIAAAIPKTGGLFVYLKELYGEKWAFLFGWVESVVYVPASSAALAIIFVTQATYFIPMNGFTQKIVAICIILFIMIVNTISAKTGGKIQGIATVAKLIPIAIIILLGMAKGTVNSPISTTHITGVVGAGFGAAIIGTLWAYDGWISVGNMSGELKNPKKDLPKSIIMGLSMTMVVYVLFNYAIIKILPIESIINSKQVSTDAAVVLFGTSGAAFIAVGILISIFGALNGYFMTGARIPYAMAIDDLAPFNSFFKKLNKGGTPVNCLIFEFVLAALYVMSGSFDTLTDLVVFVLWIFFTMAVGGVFILRKKYKPEERPYKVPFYPVIPIIGILGGVYIMFSTIMNNTTNAIYGIVITLIGIPIYMTIKKRKA